MQCNANIALDHRGPAVLEGFSPAWLGDLSSKPHMIQLNRQQSGLAVCLRKITKLFWTVASRTGNRPQMCNCALDINAKMTLNEKQIYYSLKLQ